MMRRAAVPKCALLAGLGLAAALPAAAEVNVAVNDGRVDLSARSAPLAEVLDRLARQTAMEVTYEGAPPRNLVTAALLSATPAQAVLSVLEGLGLNYAIQLDRTGRQVRTLLLITRTGHPVRTPGATPDPTPALRPPVPPPDDSDEEPVVEDDEPAVEVRPERPGERMGRPGRPDRPGVFEPGMPPGAAPFPPPNAPPPAYPVSPFAPVAPGVAPVPLVPAPPPDPNPPSS
jgi:hypothetical protein